MTPEQINDAIDRNITLREFALELALATANEKIRQLEAEMGQQNDGE